MRHLQIDTIKEAPPDGAQPTEHVVRLYKSLNFHCMSIQQYFYWILKEFELSNIGDKENIVSMVSEFGISLIEVPAVISFGTLTLSSIIYAARELL